MSDQGSQASAQRIDALTRRRFITNLGLGAGLIAGSAILQACRGNGVDVIGPGASPSPTSTDGIGVDELSLGWIQPLTGRLAEAYAPAYLTARMAIEEINDSGGILGVPLASVQVDDEGSPAGQATVAQRLAQAGVPIALGPTGSSQALASVRALAPHNVIQSAWGAPPDLGDASQFPFHYQLVMNSVDQGAAATRFLFDHQGARTIGVIAEDTDFGSAITDAMRATLADEFGAELASVQIFPVDETDMTPYVRELQRAGVDGVGIWSGQPGATALSLRAMGSFDFMPTIVVHDLNYPPGLYDDVPDELMSRFYGTIYPKLTYEPGSAPEGPTREWAERILAHPDMVPGAEFAGAGSPYFDWLMLLKHVIEDVRSFDPVRIKDALDRIDGYEGLRATVRFTPDNHSGIGADAITIGTMASALDEVSLGVFRERVPGT